MTRLLMLALWGAFLCSLYTWGGVAGQQAAYIATVITVLIFLFAEVF